MPVIEKNDVDISRLFVWSKEVVLSGLKGKDIKVYVRLLGDADVNRSRVASLRRSAEFRRALKDPNSDEHLAFIPDSDEIGSEGFVESVIIYNMRDLTKRAMKGAVIPSPKDPGSDATTEQLEKFQKEVDEYPKVRESEIRKKLESLIEEYRKELSEKSEEELYKLFSMAIIAELCEQELLQRFKEYCVFFGTFSDKKLTKRFFNDFSEVEDLPKEIKNILIDAYSSLEVESEILKK